MKASLERRTKGVSQRPESFLSATFLRKTKKELEKIGFVSDEHDFAPYREALSKHCSEIGRELRRLGFRGHLAPGQLMNHPAAGYAYFLYDTNRFGAKRDAEAAVARWLDQKYQDEAQA